MRVPHLPIDDAVYSFLHKSVNRYKKSNHDNINECIIDNKYRCDVMLKFCHHLHFYSTISIFRLNDILPLKNLKLDRS